MTPPERMVETGRFGALGQKFNQLLAFAKSLRLVPSRTLDINRTVNGTSIEIKNRHDITVQSGRDGDSVWS